MTGIMDTSLDGASVQEKFDISFKELQGVHLTAQLSKVMERLLRSLFLPFLMKHDSFGRKQFAYMEGRGARDAPEMHLHTCC